MSLLRRGAWSLIGINPLARRRQRRPDIGDEATAQQVRLAGGRVYRRGGSPLGAEIAEDQPVPPPPPNADCYVHGDELRVED